MQYALLEQIKDQMQPGDQLAFCGYHITSRIIRLFSKGVSHIEPLFRQDGQMMSAGALPKGGIVRSVEEAVNDTGGEVWWLKVRKDLKRDMDEEKYNEFIMSIAGVKYDYRRFWKSAIDPKGKGFFARLFRNKEDYAQIFCSEWSAGALEIAKIVRNINASEQMPSDVVRWNIYEDYWQLKGAWREIRRFNTVDV